jgi:hypothetical protein
MTSINTVIYCGGEMGPDTDKVSNIGTNGPTVQSSGVSTVVLWALHIGRPTNELLGDLMFNSSQYTLVSQGMYNPAFNNYPAEVASLKQSPGVSKIFFSVGGWRGEVRDFRTIAFMIKQYGYGPSSPLYQNFLALRNAFTIDGVCAIDGIDLDCEEDVDPSVIYQFSDMLFDLDFEVTFCPYENPTTFWQPAMQSLWNAGRQVSWWNLQCYSGGDGNMEDLSQWLSAIGAATGGTQESLAAAPSYLVPGLGVAGSGPDGKDPAKIQSSFANNALPAGITGGFLWDNGTILANETNGSPALTDYVKAINNGLSTS